MVIGPRELARFTKALRELVVAAGRALDRSRRKASSRSN
jgi:hypothetical protein